ncbi:MAG: tetratricopeptide repeat protein [Verrucomicrobiota bacterium]
MRLFTLTNPKRAASLAALLLVLATPDPSAAFLGGIFGKKKSNPAAGAGQEGTALALYNEGTSAELAKNYNKARDIYQQVVSQYPATNAAAQSQFKIGEVLEREGKEKKAFDAYQLFIEDYKGSSLFTEAIQRQFNIVNTARDNRKKGILGFGGGLQTSDQVEMLDQIAKNAPFSTYAPESRFLAAEIQRDAKQYDAAIIQYQTFVREYPDDPKAPAAQYQVAKLLQEEAANANNDSSQLGLTRNAYEEVLIQFPDSALVPEVREQLSSLEQQELSKFFDIAKFYEKTEKYPAAVIYYQRVTKQPAAEDFDAAKQRLAALRESHPEAFTEGGKPIVVEATTDVKGRDDYVGPPNLAALAKADTSKIRNPMNDVVPTPMEEPDLPDSVTERPTEEPTPGLLLPPIDAEVDSEIETEEVILPPSAPSLDEAAPPAPDLPTIPLPPSDPSSPSTAQTDSQE